MVPLTSHPVEINTSARPSRREMISSRDRQDRTNRPCGATAKPKPLKSRGNPLDLTFPVECGGEASTSHGASTPLLITDNERGMGSWRC